VPLLEQPDGDKAGSVRPPGTTVEKICQEALESGDRWMIVGAILATKPEFLPQHLSDLENSDKFSDSLIQDVANYFTTPLAERSSWTDFFINRVFFLKTVSLLNRLFLDELLSINRALIREEFPAGTQLAAPGQILQKMYIIYQGTVRSISDNDASPGSSDRLISGAYIGEMALLQDYPLDLTVVAQTDTTILTLARSKFEQLIEVCPRLLTCLSGTPE
jgi:hypothetical protein